MTICDGSGLLRVRGFAVEQFLIVYGGSHDLRWALAALVLRSLAALCTSGRAWFAALTRNLARKGDGTRAGAPADTTLAAARR